MMYNTRVGIYRYCMHRVRFEIRSRAALMTLSIIICYIIYSAVAVAAEEYHFEWSTRVKYKNALVSEENPFFTAYKIP